MAHNGNLDQYSEIYRELRNDLLTVKEYFDREEYLLAINRANYIVHKAVEYEIKDIESAAQSLINDVRIVVQEKTEKSICLINQALKEDDIDKAKNVFSKAIEIDPESTELRNIERTIEQKIVEIENQNNQRIIERRLRNYRNFGELREAVHAAEAMNPDSTFSSELLSLYRKTRIDYEKKAGEFRSTTTKAEIGDLKERAFAVKEIFDQMTEGREVWFDEHESAKDRPIVDVYRENKEKLNRIFLDDLNHEVEYIKRDDMLAEPEISLQRVKNRFSLFNKKDYSALIEKNYLPQLEKILNDLEKSIGLKKKALSILKKAEQNGVFPIERLRYAVDAKETFEYLKGIDRKIDRYKKSAAEDIALEAKNYLDLAQIYIAQNNRDSFHLAKEQINKAEITLKNWFLPDIPEIIMNSREESNSLRNELIQCEDNLNQVEQKLKDISIMLEDTQSSQHAIEIFEEIKNNPKFANFSQVKNFEKVIIRKKEKRQLQLDAEIAYREKDWDLLTGICKELLTKDLEINVRNKILEYSQKAQAEKLIVLVQNSIKLGDVAAAQKGFNQIAAIDPNLIQRLSIEQKVINNCVEFNDKFAQLFKKAEELSEQPDLELNLKALNIYKFLKGSAFETDEDFPPYTLNFYSQKSEGRVNELSDEIRKRYLDPIISFIDSEPALEKKNFHRAQELSKNGRLLRKKYLATDENCKVKIFEIQKYFAELQRVLDERIVDTDRLLSVWSQLREDYPGNIEIEGLFIEVSIEVIQRKVHMLVLSGKLQDAIDLIQSNRNQPGLAKDMALSFLLIELMIENRNFILAEEELSRIPNNSKFLPRKEELTEKLIRQREFNSWIENLDENIENEEYIEALLLINSIIDNHSDLKNNSRILIKKQEISQKGQNFYSHLSQPGLATDATYAEKIKAVESLIELGKFEDLINLPRKRRQSIRNLLKLSQELVDVLPEMLNDLNIETIDKMPINKIEKKFQEKRLRINALIYICKTLSSSRGLPTDRKEMITHYKRNLDNASKQNAKSVMSLEKVKPLLDRVANEQVWEEAWQSGTWDELINIHTQITDSEFEGLIEVRNFRDRLNNEQELYKFLSEKTQEIRNQFNKGAFLEVCNIFRDIRVLPTMILPSTSKNIFNQALYEERKEWLDNSLSTSDYWGAYKGWSQIEKVAKKRAEELEYWSNSLKKTRNEKKDIEDHSVLLERRDNFPDEVTKYKEWDDILNRLEQLSDEIKNYKKNEAEANQAREYRDQIDELSRDLEIKIEDVKNKRGSKPDFPSAQEFRRVILYLNNNEENAIKKLIEKAERIGASNQVESERLNNAKKHYENYIEKQKNKSSSLFNKIRSLLRRG